MVYNYIYVLAYNYVLQTKDTDVVQKIVTIQNLMKVSFVHC